MAPGDSIIKLWLYVKINVTYKKVNNNNHNDKTTTMTMTPTKAMTPKQRHGCRSGVFTVNFE